MNFTELEYVLMLAVAVLLWRNHVLHIHADKWGSRADRYAGYLIKVGKGEGTIVKDDDGTWTFKRKEKHQ